VFDRLFTDPHPDAGEGDFRTPLNPGSKQVLRVFVEPSLANAKADDKFQFERNGYFVADLKDHAARSPVFNLAVSLRDSWTAAK
jgi:glutaminyl-tRNA synthetase